MTRTQHDVWPAANKVQLFQLIRKSIKNVSYLLTMDGKYLPRFEKSGQDERVILNAGTGGEEQDDFARVRLTCNFKSQNDVVLSQVSVKVNRNDHLISEETYYA